MGFDIDVSKYITVWECNCSECGKQKVMAVDDLNYLPMFEERPQGEWINCTKSGMPLTEYGRMTGEKWYGFKCSQCNFIYKGNALIDSHFCQKCGADMRVKDELNNELNELVSSIDVSKYITVWECNCSECGKQKVMAVDDLNYLKQI